LIIGMSLASGINPVNTLVVFGLMEILTALFYGIPMPVQPLKAVAVLVIAGNIAPSTIYGAGLSIGIVMLLLSFSGMLERLNNWIPRSVIRGIQLALGIKLLILALFRYIPSQQTAGIILALVCAAIIMLLANNRRCPPAVPVLVLGIVYALVFNANDLPWKETTIGFALPRLQYPSLADIVQGFFLLSLSQIPLSLGNSIFATQTVANDLFPEKRIRVRTLGFTYAALNIIAPFVGGIPVCHGAGGLAGHYFFGGRTGGSVIIYGSFLIAMGLIFAPHLQMIAFLFPLPALGVILAFQGFTLMRLAGDIFVNYRSLAIVTLVCAVAVFAPHGFLFGMIIGIAADKAICRFSASAL
jgi:hypothetical protein